jgi:uncharacterized membrane protein
MLPLALLAAALNRRSPVRGYAARRPTGPAARLRRSPSALLGFGLAAAGELVGDELPFIPGRIEPPLFAERLIIGALVGGAVGDLGGRSPWVGAAIGAATSGAVAALGYFGRVTLGRVTPLSQLVWGVVEDGFALGLGARMLGLRRR